MQFDFIVCPYTDATSMGALTSFLNDPTGRWSYLQQLYGTVYYGYSGTYSALTTFGTALNDQHSSVMGFSGSPTPPWRWAAAVAGARAVSARADPAAPMQTVILQGVLAPPIANQFPASERNTLLYDGISTFTVDQAGNVAIENLITTYQLNALGVPDNSYLEVETLDTLAAILRDLKAVVTQKYSRVKIGDPGVRYDASAGVVTTTSIKSDLIARYQWLCTVKAWAVNAQEFAQGISVQQNPTDPNRIDVYWPGDIIAGLRRMAFSIAFTNGLTAN
jgi:phage tail sheath gpL-like